MNVVYWGNESGDITSTDCAAFEAAFQHWFDGLTAPSLSEYISTTYSVHQFRHYVVPGSAGPFGAPFLVNNPTTLVGAGTSEALPPQVSMTVTMRTAIRRRWGRIYIPGLVQTTLDKGRINATVVDNIAAGFKDLVEELRSSGAVGPVIWHRQSWTPQTITEISADNVWDVQRRRRLQEKSHLYEFAF